VSLGHDLIFFLFSFLSLPSQPRPAPFVSPGMDSAAPSLFFPSTPASFCPSWKFSFLLCLLCFTAPSRCRYWLFAFPYFYMNSPNSFIVVSFLFLFAGKETPRPGIPERTFLLLFKTAPPVSFFSIYPPGSTDFPLPSDRD